MLNMKILSLTHVVEELKAEKAAREEEQIQHSSAVLNDEEILECHKIELKF